MLTICLSSSGEDRWLCTLLLQRGYRVEYSAASDAYTHCPEGFSEFYNQRRRWVPSTIANIMDLLMDYKHTIKINDNISSPYIAYQVFNLYFNLLTASVGYGRQVKMCPTRRRRVSPMIIDAIWAHFQLSAILDHGGQKVNRLIFLFCSTFFAKSATNHKIS
jgi:cellulose synthase/poly-beta-1,6-N-acetylglucosamine synthase-like glycosyltransferase